MAHARRSPLVVAALSGLFLVAPAAQQAETPTVDRATIWTARVTRGDLMRQVRGPGTIRRIRGQLGAEVRVAQRQFPEIRVGQPVTIDTRHAIYEGEVTRIARRVVEGTVAIRVVLHGTIPDTVIPGLSVDARIEVERVVDTLYVDRPAFAQADTTSRLYRLAADERTAEAVEVTFGATSVDKIVVLDGLEEGDQVILSDMSRYQVAASVRLRQ